MSLKSESGQVTMFALIVTFLTCGCFIVSLSYIVDFSKKYHIRSQAVLCTKYIYLRLSKYLERIRHTNKTIYRANLLAKAPNPKVSVPARTVKKVTITFQNYLHTQLLYRLHHNDVCSSGLFPLFSKGLPYGMRKIVRKKTGEAKRLRNRWSFIVRTLLENKIQGHFKWSKSKRRFRFTIKDEIKLASHSWKLLYGYQLFSL